MGVKFRAFANVSQGSGIAGGITAESFSDSFDRANTAIGLGTSWQSHHSRPTVAGVYSLARILTNQMRCFNQGGPGSPVPGSYWFPLPTITALYGRNQFAQATLTGITVAAGPACGPAVGVTSDILVNNANGYNLEVLTAATAQVVRFNSGAFNIITSGGGPLVVAVGDVLRIDVQFGSASNTVRAWRNGAIVDTITDSNAARPTTGAPSFFIFCDNGDTQDWDNYSCGIL